jgi:hypothetical protein
VEYFNQCPALHFLRANLIIASILPVDQRKVIFNGLPLNPRFLQLASDNQSRSKIADARRELKAVLDLVEELRLFRIQEYLLELDLWLQLEDSQTAASARATISKDLADSAKTLRRVRLALAYDITFNRDALSRHLRSQREVGGWSEDERFAAFLLAFHSDDPATMAEFFDKFRDDLFSQEQLATNTLAGIEIQSLMRTGRFEEARQRLEQHKGVRLSPEEADHLGQLISSVEQGNESERIRQLYEQSEGHLGNLRLLVNSLFRDRDYRQMAAYAPMLARATRRIEDFELALKALFHERRFNELVAFAEEMPELYELNLEFASLKAWSYYSLGEVIQARKIARDLLVKRNDQNDRELAINTAIESGDWGYLHSILAREVERLTELSPHVSIRLARLALETGSPYVDKFRDAALTAAPDDAQVNLAAYTLSVERGEEYQEGRAHEWFQRAIVLSGPEGPVQQVKLKEIVDQSAGWIRQVDKVDGMLTRADIPLYLAARALRRQPFDFLMGQAIRNEAKSDPRSQFPILAFSGARGAVNFDGVRSIALDITAIFTLQHLGLLEKAINSFDQVVIAPSTLSSLFIDRQFLRFHQPSELAKALRIKRLIEQGLLKIMPERTDAPRSLSSEVGPGLAAMLTQAKASRAIVVRSAPVHRVHSLLEETVDLSDYADVLADTQATLAFLTGTIESSRKESASAYLAQVDKGWPTNPSIASTTTLYLDDLSVTYLDHVGILEAVTRSVAAVFVDREVSDNCEAVIRGAAHRGDQIGAVERLRAIINAGVEKGTIRFSARRPRALDDEQEMETRASFPTVDIMSNLSGIDVVVCDDRFLNKDGFWDDSHRRAPVGNTADLLAGLNSRTVLSEEDKRGAFHKLRTAGYYAVPLNAAELLTHLDRAVLKDGVLSETPELRAIRESITLGRRSGVFLNQEDAWLLAVRLAFVRAIHALWSSYPLSDLTTAKADWLIAVLPDPLAWYLDPDNERIWDIAVHQAVVQSTLLLSFFHVEKRRREDYSAWIEQSLVIPLRVSHPWLWKRVVESFKSYLTHLLEREDEKK